MKYSIQILSYILLCFGGVLFAQNHISIQHRWNFQDIQNLEGTSLIPISSSDYFLIHPDGNFEYSLKAKNLLAKGAWEINGDTLSYNYYMPSDTTRYYIIKTLNDTSLIINEGSVNYMFSRQPAKSD